MATAPMFTVTEHGLETQGNASERLGLPVGTKLFVISSSGDEITLRRQHAQICRDRSLEEYMAGWDRLRGLMQDGVDTADERRSETAWELEHDRRKFGDA